MSRTEEKEKEEIEVSTSDFVDARDPHIFEYAFRLLDDLECVERYEDKKFVSRTWVGDEDVHAIVVKHMAKLYPNGVLTSNNKRSAPLLRDCETVADIFPHSGMKDFILTQVPDER